MRLLSGCNQNAHPGTPIDDGQMDGMGEQFVTCHDELVSTPQFRYDFIMTSPWQGSAIFVVRQTGTHSPYLDTASSVGDR